MDERSLNMDNVFNEHSKCIKVYLATETETDPFEHTVELTQLNPFSVKGIITDLVASQMQWKMPGIVADKAKEIIIKKKYRSLIEQSVIIGIDNELYEGWKVNGKMQMREEGNYLRLYIYNKKV